MIKIGRQVEEYICVPLRKPGLHDDSKGMEMNNTRIALAKIPASHRDLIDGPYRAALTIVMPDGQPQSNLVWVDYDGSHVLINTTLELQKRQNIRANPRVTLLVVDPKNTSGWIEVRGHVAQITQEGAVAHAYKLTQRYTGKRHFYGDIYEVEQQQRETRVTVRIEPVKVSLDAIFK
jgi:PPOX class probable F420-dependent enzyme